MKPLIIIDVDGTVTNFKRIDHEIIYDMFHRNKLVMMFDNLLWKINGLDYFTNKFWIFKLRILLYSLFSLTGYKLNMIKYQKEYVQKTREDCKEYFEILHPVIEDLGYETLLLSHDRFASNVDDSITCTRDKKRYVLNNTYSKYDVIYVVGNNYMDDIKLGMSLRKLNERLGVKLQTNIVYVGESKWLIKNILQDKPIKCVGSLEDFVKLLLKE